ncbi:hypothetical protein LJD47_25320, partial [Escherichia coli]|nr:hypothetical protein [Escherichia coli]
LSYRYRQHLYSHWKTYAQDGFGKMEIDPHLEKVSEIRRKRVILASPMPGKPQHRNDGADKS